MGQKARQKASFSVKSQIIQELAKAMSIPISTAALAVETVFSEITKALLKSQTVQIRGFGVFETRRYKGYKGKNPQTGEVFHIKQRKLPFFKPGSIKKEINKK